ncbi:MAG: redoxin domain-containing protein [Planctomycetes bacterium]|nr:redoxin domain-containing protein [Planctomycetota bacterium]
MRDELGGEDGIAQVLAIDPHESWSAKYLLKDSGLETADVNFPLLMDPSLTVSATYGVAFQMRIHTELSNRPATFIIDKQGVIRYARRAKSFGDRPSLEQIAAELEKLKGE